MANYTLEEVTSRRAAREFLDLPKRLYRDEPHWICPLDSDIENRFRPQTNELLHDGEAIRWIALDEQGRAVGRIAAFYNRELVKASEYQPTGGCGFFESIDDQRVADLLFDAARDWLAARGLEAMDGPINFGQRDAWWGLLVEGYEFQPLYENPYNPPYYKELFENYGFRNYFNQNTYIWKIYDDDVNAMVHDRAKRLFSTPGYGFRQIDMSRIEEEAENFRIIYNKAWSLFSGVKPMTQEEAMKIMETMKPIIDPEIIFFAYFYSTIQYNPIEMANNLRKNNGAIPGIRPGKPTSDYIMRVLSRLTLIGSLMLCIVALFPIVYSLICKAAIPPLETGGDDGGMSITLGGTSIIIMCGVALETVRQLESQLMMRHYKGFLD